MTNVLDEESGGNGPDIHRETPVSGGANLGYTRAQCSARTTVLTPQCSQEVFSNTEH